MGKPGRPRGKTYVHMTSLSLTTEQRTMLDHASMMCNKPTSAIIRDLIENCLISPEIPYEFADRCKIDKLVELNASADTVLQYVAIHLGENITPDNKLRGIRIDICPQKGVTPILQAIQSTYRILHNEETEDIRDRPAGSDE